MSDEQDKKKLKPLFLIPPGSISRDDIQRAEELTGICIIECSEPESARFLDPPMMVDADAQALAAWRVMRYVSTNTGVSTSFYGGDLVKMFVNILLDGSLPQPVKKVKK